MPLINYVCSCGHSVKKYYKSNKDVCPSVSCEKCGSESKKVFGATSSSHKVTIDNGVMARRVEVNPDIMTINDDRSDKDYTEE